ncbi:MAG: polysaccharide pyruvyl transferase family protein [Pseudomonadota bacterium]
MSELARIVRETGEVPLAWAGGTTGQDYLNLGDALSPVMVALLSGKPVKRVPFVSRNPRLVAVGTIGQNVSGGRAWFWGTGCGRVTGRSTGLLRRFTPDSGTDRRITSTRGPFSAALLGGGRAYHARYGDPVSLLPRFYAPKVEKRYELGVIVHLSDLADREIECHPNADHRRYAVPEALKDSVRLINTVTPVSAEGLRDKLDEILSCRRIVSTSLHGLVIADSYGIPCLPFPAREKRGLERQRIDFESPLDLRVTDYYGGLGRDRLAIYGQPRDLETNWEAVMTAVDKAWEPVDLAATDAALTGAFPVDLAPLAVAEGEEIWSHPLIAGLGFSHDVRALRVADRAAAADNARAGRQRERSDQSRLRALNAPSACATLPCAAPGAIASRRRLRLADGPSGPSLPLSWAAGRSGDGFANIGDALSAVVVSGLSGLPVLHTPAACERERLAAVGTIGHLQCGGRVHVWGTGFDAARNPVAAEERYAPPPQTELVVHATRGPFSAAVLRRHGVQAPEVFGDPVYLLPRIFPLDDVEKTHELGVVLHLTEIEPRNPTGMPKEVFPRYTVPEALSGTVRLINMYADSSMEAFEAKLAEIASCRRILSTSLHGLVIADAYGVPSAWFGFYGTGLDRIDLLDPRQRIDHRMRDLYAGIGLAEVPIFSTPRHTETDWDAAIAAFDDGIETTGFDPTPLLEAFPGPLAVSPADNRWPVPRAQLSGVTL